MNKPVYKNFQELIEKNQSIFHLFRKSQYQGFLEGIWSSRDGEMEFYQEQLSQAREVRAKLESDITEEENKLNESSEQIDGLKNDIERLETRLEGETAQSNFFIDETQAYQSKVKGLTEQLKKTWNFVKNLERAFKMTTAKNQKLQKDNLILEENLQMSHLTIIKLDSEVDDVKIQLQKQKLEYEGLLQELEKSESYGRQQKKLNFKMSNELYKVSNDLEHMNSFGN